MRQFISITVFVTQEWKCVRVGNRQLSSNFWTLIFAIAMVNWQGELRQSTIVLVHAWDWDPPILLVRLRFIWSLHGFTIQRSFLFWMVFLLNQWNYTIYDLFLLFLRYLEISQLIQSINHNSSYFGLCQNENLKEWK